MALPSITMVSGVKAESNFSTNRVKPDFAEGIALLDPNENPLTLMMTRLPRGTSGSLTHRWLFDQLVPETDQINFSTGYSNSATGFVVDNASRFALGDVVRINRLNENVLVTSVGSTFIGVVRDFGQSTESWTAAAGSVVDNDWLTILNNAFMAGFALPTVRSTQEVEQVNYLQEIRTPFAVTEKAADAVVFGEDQWPYEMRKAGITHQRKQEYQHIWGKPYRGTRGLASTTNLTPETGGGVFHYVTEYAPAVNKKVASEINEADWDRWVRHCFRYGSREKLLLAAPIFFEAFEYWGKTKLQTFTAEKTSYGLDIVRWISPHGTINLVIHKMLEDPAAAGSDGATALLLDMADLKRITYNTSGETRMRTLTPYEATGETVKKAEYQTISCLELRRAAHHGVWTGALTIAA